MDQVINGRETFKDLDGTIYRRPGAVNVGDTVGMVDKREIAITGQVDAITVINKEIWVKIDIGAKDPLPRKLNGPAVPVCWLQLLHLLSWVNSRAGPLPA